QEVAGQAQRPSRLSLHADRGVLVEYDRDLERHHHPATDPARHAYFSESAQRRHQAVRGELEQLLPAGFLEGTRSQEHSEGAARNGPTGQAAGCYRDRPRDHGGSLKSNVSGDTRPAITFTEGLRCSHLSLRQISA